MATSSRTDVTAFGRLPYTNKSSRGKNTHEPTARRLNAKKHLDLHYLNTGTDSSGQLKGKKHSNGTVSKDAVDSEEGHLTDEQNSDEIGTSAQLKVNGKRGFRKKMANTEGVKRLKQSTSKKDNSWRQNSRSRRLVANARERSRIHILSDAFENLRRAVPCYSQDQKLSKLAILKLATYYISALANLTESDTSARSLKQFADCVAHCTNALQTEGRSRRKNY
jgi:atonal protein 8